MPTQEDRQGLDAPAARRPVKTSRNLGTLFLGVKVDEALFEELETALLMADAGVEATEYLLGELRRRVKNERIEGCRRRQGRAAHAADRPAASARETMGWAANSRW